MPIEIGEKEVAGVVGLFGLLTGWIISGFNYSKKHGKNEGRLDTIEEDVSLHTLAIAKLNQIHDEDMKEVRAFFSTPNGGQKFMTFPDHDAACMLAQRSTVQEISHLTTAIVDNTHQVVELAKKVGEVQISVAILQEEKNFRDANRRRRSDDV